MTLTSITLGLLGTIFLAFIKDELLSWSPKFADWLLIKSTASLPKEIQERMLEEWRAHMITIPGKISKLLFAIDSFRSVHRICNNLFKPHFSPIFKVGVRCTDIIMSSILIVVAWPSIILTSLAVKICSTGRPLLNKTAYIGKNGKIIYLYRFCTVGLLSNPRKLINKFGRLLIVTRIDGLPLILNVVRGDLSLVGPRPLIKNGRRSTDAKNTVKGWSERLQIRPGITGFTQIQKNYFGMNIEEEFATDIKYIKNASIFLNIKVMFKAIYKLGF